MATPKKDKSTRPSDKPANVNLTFAQLQREAAAPELFTVQFPNGFVTFPDIFDKEVEEGAKFLEELESAKSNDIEVLRNWLPEKDFKIVQGAKLKLREHSLLMKNVLTYYRDTVGTTGESDASESS